jgi:hypothetical protein
MVRTIREVVHQIGRSALDHPRTPATRIRSRSGRTREPGRSISNAADKAGLAVTL